MADPSEALRLHWTDANGNTIMLNYPVKGHHPRPVQVTNNLISLLNSLPKISELVFPVSYAALSRCYTLLRKRVAQKTNNPRILKITLTTFRHYGATYLYFQTKNILLVKKLLGHKKIENTIKYTQLAQFKDDEYEETTAPTVEEARKLGKTGWIKYDEFNGIHFYRKPKRFIDVVT
jgi:integrase